MQNFFSLKILEINQNEKQTIMNGSWLWVFENFNQHNIYKTYDYLYCKILNKQMMIKRKMNTGFDCNDIHSWLPCNLKK